MSTSTTSPARLQVDFHCHTIYSKDSLTRPEQLLTTCQRKGIDRVVITDHNTIAGALQAQKLDPVRFIVGEEIKTSNGSEILAAYVKEEIPKGLAPMEAIERLRQQDAFISVSHPFDRLRKGHWELEALLEILPYVDALETFNARCLDAGFNSQAQEFARQHNLPGTAGSDAHTVMEVGSAALLLPGFNDAASLRQAVRVGEVTGKLMPFWVHFLSRYAVWYKESRRKQSV